MPSMLPADRLSQYKEGSMKAIKETRPNQTPFAQLYPEKQAATLIQPADPLGYTSKNYSPCSARETKSEETVPTARRLTQLLAHLSQEGTTTSSPINVKALDDIHSLIRKYGSKWPNHGDRIIQPVSKERVVVTGTTGALGSYLLSQLLKSDRVEKVWALNRKSSKGNSREREISSFEDKRLDTGLLNSEKLVFVDADLREPKLNLTHSQTNILQIRSGVTIIIHAAWEVNHSRSLKLFESNICGTRHLLDLAFNSIAPTGLPRFAFTSSIAAAGLAPPGRRLSEIPIAFEDAVTSDGYGQGKFVTEKLLESARHAGLSTCIIRISQLSGDFNSGSWSTTNWLPLIISSSISIGCLPGAIGTVSWLPLDVAARSIVDICISRAIKLPLVVHVSHPRPVRWMTIMSGCATSILSRTGSRLPIVNIDEWSRRISEAAESFEGSKADRYKRFPIIKIQGLLDSTIRSEIEFRTHGHPGHAEFTGVVRLDITIAKVLSETLNSTPELEAKHVERWFEYWDSVGFFKAV
ncbi:L-aminoadipate-semialdehyde dehydrogenase large subunit [Rhizoctonia solani]|uniref:L-aminoadipate-semialdehyde dehydrogenase large subunit n=1 Tax=Rhizoctonia solani TaxID=456999 RepID=A0A0K6FX46_9AGAM|nr:L-aminoadipate-semialdehyde dehydrogenase large subunit [Rhizoctonia solani]